MKLLVCNWLSVCRIKIGGCFFADEFDVFPAEMIAIFCIPIFAQFWLVVKTLACSIDRAETFNIVVPCVFRLRFIFQYMYLFQCADTFVYFGV